MDAGLFEHPTSSEYKEVDCFSAIDFFQKMVRETGLEPVRQRHTHLKRACLPVPAFSHIETPDTSSAGIIITPGKRSVNRLPPLFRVSDVGLSKMSYTLGKEERTCLGERQFKGRMGKWL